MEASVFDLNSSRALNMRWRIAFYDQFLLTHNEPSRMVYFTGDSTYGDTSRGSRSDTVFWDISPGGNFFVQRELIRLHTVLVVQTSHRGGTTIISLGGA